MNPPHKRTFFEAISAASMERMHSEMIAWIFSRDCTAINETEKVKALVRWFDISDPSNEEIQFSTTEVGRIDILIGTTRHLFVIENKLKSSVHSNQLSRYSEYVQNFKFGDQGKKTHYRLLSLVGEDASIKEAPSAWDNTSYEDFLTALQATKREVDSNDSVILAEYEKTLSKLVGCFGRFIESPHLFQEVFTEGNKKKSDAMQLLSDEAQKANAISEDLAFIRANQLQTIFQKAYLEKVAGDLDPAADFSLVGETRGVALLDIKAPFECRCITIGGEILMYGIQFQANTVKVQIESGYDGHRSPITDRIEEKAKVLKEYVANNKDRFELSNWGWRFNDSRRANSAYCSFSKRICSGDEVWKRPYSEAIELYRASRHDALATLQIIHEKLAHIASH